MTVRRACAFDGRAPCLHSAENVFLTGGAGTGKSFTLNHIVKALKQQRGEGQVFVTASTGIAACHIGGTTLHSFAGVGLARESASDLASRVMGNRTSMRRWTGASVLVIDEVSMLDGTFFDGKIAGTWEEDGVQGGKNNGQFLITHQADAIGINEA